MSVKDKIGKLLYLDKVEAQALKEIAVRYKVSESTIMRKALYNYMQLYSDLVQELEKQHSLFKRGGD